MSKLTDAAKAGDIAKVKKLLAEGAKPMEKDSDGNTALILATKKGHTEIVTALLAIDPSKKHVNHPNPYGNTALISAADRGHTEIVQALLVVQGTMSIILANGATPR